MRELPILFSAPMVRAILDGRKTATRRVIKPLGAVEIVPFIGADNLPTGEFGWCPHPRLISEHIRPPYQVGDRLWVREAWRAPASLDACSGTDIAERCLEAGYRTPWAPVRFEADGVLNSPKDWREFGSTPGEATPGRYRHARFMPRWAGRITLEVTAVRVERLQDISDAQAQEEGLIQLPASGRFVVNAGEQYFGGASDDPREVFSWLWDGLAKPGTRWADNPYVWVAAFRRVEVSSADPA